MQHQTTQHSWMGREDSHTNRYGVEMQEKHAVPSRNATAVEVSRSGFTSNKMPDIMVPDIDAPGVVRGRLTIGDSLLVDCKMARACFGDALNGAIKIAFGWAYIDEDTEKQQLGCWKGEQDVTVQTCSFNAASCKTLESGEIPNHVLLHVAWSKSEGSIYEEVRPFNASCAWAGGHGALYVGRRIDSRGERHFAPIHGVDLIVLPITACAPDKLEALISDYVSAAKVVIAQRKAHLEASKVKAPVVQKAVKKLTAELEVQEKSEAEAAEVEKQARQKREEALRSMAFSTACNLMTRPNYGKARAL